MLENGTLILDRYRVLEFLGDGSFGEVYKVFDTVYRRIVAVKIIRRKVSDSAQEAISLAKTDHPNVVKVNNFVGLSEMAIIEMPFADGGNLQKKLEKWGPLPLEVAANFLHQMGVGLDYIHANSIIHNDFKPLNVLLFQPTKTTSGQPELFWDWKLQICDFGLARVIQDDQSYLQSKSIGTLAYCAPEEFEEQIRPEGDIYALGITLYQMLTGDLPFKGTPGQVVHAHQHKPLPSLTQFRRDIAPEIDNLLAAACAKDPKQRLKSGQELADRFAELLTHSNLTAYFPSGGQVSRPENPNATATVSVQNWQLTKLQPPAFAPKEMLGEAQQAIKSLVERFNQQPRRGIATALKISPDGYYLAFGCDQAWFDLGMVQSVGEEVGTPEVQRLTCDGKLSTLIFEPQGAKLIAGTQSGQLHFWQKKEGSFSATPQKREFHNDTVSDLWFTPGGLLFSAGYDGRLVRWQNNLESPQIILQRNARLLALTGLPSPGSGYRLISAWDDGSLQLCREDGAQASELLSKVGVPNGLLVATTADGQRLAVGDPDAGLYMWRNEARGLFSPQIYDLPTPYSSLTALAFSPYADQLAAGFSDGSLWRAHLDRPKLEWQLLTSVYLSTESLRPAVRLLNWLLPTQLLAVYYDGKFILEKLDD